MARSARLSSLIIAIIVPLIILVLFGFFVWKIEGLLTLANAFLGLKQKQEHLANEEAVHGFTRISFKRS